MKRAVFLDKDGTLIDDVPYNVDPDRLRLAPHAGPALRLMQELGYRLIVVSNQSGVARGLFSEAALPPLFAALQDMLAREGVTLDGWYWCPHHPEGAAAGYALECNCRKPLPGMLQQAAREHGIDLARSWMVGDILNDVEAGRRAGCRTVLINNGNETEWLRSPLRTPDISAPDLLSAARAMQRFDAAMPVREAS
ncbi:HAD family hydrolase|uniref:D-glycero-alpha-D-manno-heptose-1,7-bisphosphate 7-phosphatase n=1 Tax=Noviherbaspirillum sp. L7-7A TaxID=2850560 RepID=UPI001C2B7BE8|nr:HAD family hydrolase [Noviherbaspirillum sp. L7-7A]MBV0881176.1 HAD family hydrolase [Noviherbaspirillum sp. L7-7A]